MKVQSLGDIYSSLCASGCTVFVVPKIRHQFPKSDYLSLLYQPLSDSDNYSIQSLSFFQHYKMVLTSIRSKDVILHYHWLEFQDIKSLFGMPWKLFCIMLFKLFGGKIIWTVHNISPHQQKWISLNLRMQQWMAGISDKIHIHCSSTSKLISETFNISEEKLFIHPHPAFPSSFVDREEAIDHLNSNFGTKLTAEKPILLIFGNIAEYKNIENILDIVISNEIAVQILIAGTVKKGEHELGKRLKVYSNSEKDISLIPEYISEDDIPFLFGAANFCVFNFKTILTSGSVEMALSFKKTIIAPDLGCISELGTHENVYLFETDTKKIELLKSLTATFYNEQD